MVILPLASDWHDYAESQFRRGDAHNLFPHFFRREYARRALDYAESAPESLLPTDDGGSSDGREQGHGAF